MSEPISEAMLTAGLVAYASRDDCTNGEVVTAIFRAMEAARDAGKVELSPAAKDLVLRLAMGEQPNYKDGQTSDLINEAREHRLVEPGNVEMMVRWGQGEITPMPPGVDYTKPYRMVFRLTDKGAAYIAKETSNDDR